MLAKPLFVPLKGEWFDKFADGSKDVEYRKHGPGWNERTVYAGRRVTLSRGYSGARLDAAVVSFELVKARDVPRATEIYPPDATLIAVKFNVQR